MRKLCQVLKFTAVLAVVASSYDARAQVTQCIETNGVKYVQPPRVDGGWDVLGDGLADPLPAMPYALVATSERLFAGLANGELWESRDRGDSWEQCELVGSLPKLNALVPAGRRSATLSASR